MLQFIDKMLINTPPQYPHKKRPFAGAKRRFL